MELSSEQRRRIHQRAERFVERWTRKHNVTECRESQTFINEFFGVFDIDRFASKIQFEYDIARNRDYRRIDVFWPGVILIENKTPGESLDQASKQAKRYFDMLGERHLPKYVLINNFRIFRIHSIDVKNKELTLYKTFHIEKLPEEINSFYYFLDHDHQKITKDVIEKPIERVIKEIVYKVRWNTLILASGLSLALGYIVSDGQPRAFLESLIQESGTIQDRFKADAHLPPPTFLLAEAGLSSCPSVSGATQLPPP